jgi:hypothetical protein
MMDQPKINPKEPFTRVYGSPTVAYEQNGHQFDHRGQYITAQAPEPEVKVAVKRGRPKNK